MFIGHYGPAVWDTQRGHGKPIVKLWEAFLAVQAMDIVCGFLVMFGIEGMVLNADGKPIFDINWSHSLVTSIVIALIAGGIFKALRPQSGMRGFWVIAMLAFSHWLLDLIVHRPDLPLYPGGDLLLGFALWDLPWIAFALEAGLLFLAFAWWQKLTIAKNKKYDYGLWALYLFMVLVHFAAIVHQGIQVKNGTFDMAAQPPSSAAGISMLVMFVLFTFIISRIERGRPSKFQTA